MFSKFSHNLSATVRSAIQRLHSLMYKNSTAIVEGFPDSAIPATPSVPASNLPGKSGISALDIVNLMLIVTEIILNE